MKTKLLSCILLSAMALGATQAFAQNWTRRSLPKKI